MKEHDHSGIRWWLVVLIIFGSIWGHMVYSTVMDHMARIIILEQICQVEEKGE